MAQQFRKLVQEDLNVGTLRVWVQSPARGRIRATQLGLHSLALGQTAYEATWDPGAIAAGAHASTTVTVPGAVVTDMVRVAHDGMGKNNLRLSGYVSAADTVTAVMQNMSSASVTVTGTLRAMALRFI